MSFIKAEDAELIHLRLSPTEAAALDAYIASQPAPKPDRSEAIRQIVKASLAFSLTL